jgi:hypothetical protein
MAVGRHAADREAGALADERGVGLLQPERLLVDGVRAAAQDEHRRVVAQEHQRLHDLADLAPDRRRGVGCGARPLRELARAGVGAAVVAHTAAVGTRRAISSSVSG